MSRWTITALWAGVIAWGYVTGRYLVPAPRADDAGRPSAPSAAERNTVSADMRPSRPDWLTKCLDNPDKDAARFAFEQWLAERNELAERLKQLVDAPQTPSSTRYYAARLLAHFGAKGAPVFIKHLTWRGTEVLAYSRISPFSGYPCAEALALIGRDCVPELISSLARAESEDVAEQWVRLSAGLLTALCNRSYEPLDEHEAIALVERALDRALRPDDELYVQPRNLARLLRELEQTARKPAKVSHPGNSPKRGRPSQVVDHERRRQ